jgi:hypothetical protein
MVRGANSTNSLFTESTPVIMKLLYCHSSAELKAPGIPSLNVCMNCHKILLKLLRAQLLQSTKLFMMSRFKKYKAVVGICYQTYTGKQNL